LEREEVWWLVYDVRHTLNRYFSLMAWKSVK